jgi:hypothetical protein
MQPVSDLPVRALMYLIVLLLFFQKFQFDSKMAKTKTTTEAANGRGSDKVNGSSENENGESGENGNNASSGQEDVKQGVKDGAPVKRDLEDSDDEDESPLGNWIEIYGTGTRNAGKMRCATIRTGLWIVHDVCNKGEDCN